jgi:AraC-like DNA-binding protein
MHFASRCPGPPLDRYVDCVWLYEGDGRHPPGARWSERVLPSGTLQVIADVSPGGPCDAVPGGALVVGAHARASVVEFESRMVLVGVAFRAGGAAPFFSVPLGEVADTEAPLDLFWGRLADELRCRLHEARGDAARLTVLEQALLSRLRLGARTRDPSLHPVVQMALAQWQAGLELPSVAEVTERGGLSTRRFNDLFTAQVGQPPKRYSRLRRFQAALQRLHTAETFDGAAFALACGYYDQAHFNHDFRAFAGLTPTQYRALRTEHANHARLA